MDWCSVVTVSLFVSRLCGKVPFQGDSLLKLEAVILQGTLTFSEPEWAQVSEQGQRKWEGEDIFCVVGGEDVTWWLLVL